jgi:hypothetical protein
MAYGPAGIYSGGPSGLFTLLKLHRDVPTPYPVGHLHKHGSMSYIAGTATRHTVTHALQERPQRWQTQVSSQSSIPTRYSRKSANR